ncbi:MAG: nucleotidyltransferase domain-containing protein [Chitinophagaceae bacterium]|nr:nucleotidyltransferase domain-containing protein [Chitinophagaceae bacterium]
MVTQKTAIKTVQKFAKEIKSGGLNLRRVVLFGSYAHGKPHKWSDIDVALAADEFDGDGFKDISYFVKINIKPEFRLIETCTYNTKDFSARKNPFVSEILKTGIEISGWK